MIPIYHFFIPSSEFSSIRFLRLLGRFNGLVYLSLDYPALSDGALAALASGASPWLQLLHVAVQESDSRQHRLSDDAWRELVDVCPRLGVAYTICVFEYRYMSSYVLS